MLQYTTLLILTLDVNECASRPCLHGGTCIDHVNKYACYCVVGYVGSVCETGMLCCVFVLFSACSFLSNSRILQHLEQLSRTPWCYEYVVPSSLCHSVKTRICAPKLVNILNKHQ